MTCRFWVFWNGTESMLSLKDGEERNVSRFEITDEGFSFVRITWARTGPVIRMTKSVKERDCDGTFCEHSGAIALIGKAPNLEWKRGATVYHDGFAEAMNY